MTNTSQRESSSNRTNEIERRIEQQVKRKSLKHEKSQRLLLDEVQSFVGNIFIIFFGSLFSILIMKRLEFTQDAIRHILALLCLWLSSMMGGFLVKRVNLPPLMGMIMAGVILTNMIDGSKLAVPDEWGEIITATGLTIILLRSGLELDLKGLQNSGFTTLKLTCLPGCAEAFVCGVFSRLIFGMPLLLSLSLGFILAAVSPAVVVVGMLKLQALGYGVAKGIPSLVIAAASFDDAVAIAGFTVFIGLAIQSKENSLLLSFLHGPLSLLLGIGVGCIAGAFLSLTNLWDLPWKRCTISMLLTLTLMFLMKELSFAGSGAVSSLTGGITASYCWKLRHHEAGCGESMAHQTEKQLSTLWSILFEPLLFGIIGTALNFELIPRGTILRSFTVIFIGISVRLPVAYFATCKKDFTRQERIFISLSWLPKATVQAALCSFPLVVIKDVIAETEDDYLKYMEWGNQILSTSILSIIITAPLGLLAIEHFGPRLLSKDNHFLDPNVDTGMIQGDASNESEREGSLLFSIGKLDVLMQSLANTDDVIERKCLIAEARKKVWRCKTILTANGVSEEDG